MIDIGSPIPDHWTMNSGDTSRQLEVGMLVRYTFGKTRGKLYRVTKASESSTVITPVVGSEQLTISSKSEVEYRRDEGAPYDNGKYSAPIGSPVPSLTEKVEKVVPHSQPIQPTTRPTVRQRLAAKRASSNERDERDERDEQNEPTAQPEEEEKVITNSRTKATQSKQTRKAAPVAEPEAEAEKVENEAEAVRPKKKVASAPVKARKADKATEAIKAPDKVVAKAVRAPKTATATTAPTNTVDVIAAKAGVVETRVNTLRRAGLIPKKYLAKQGRAILYADEVVEVIKKLEAKGVKRRGRPPGAKNKKTRATNALNTATSTIGLALGALDQAIAAALGEAARYSDLAENLKAQRKLLG